MNSSFQQILVLWTLFVNLKALNTIGRHVPNVLVSKCFSTHYFSIIAIFSPIFIIVCCVNHPDFILKNVFDIFVGICKCTVKTADFRVGETEQYKYNTKRFVSEVTHYVYI